MNINKKWTLNTISILLLGSMPLGYAMQKDEPKKVKLATFGQSDALKNALLISGGCLGGYLVARAMMKDTDAAAQLSQSSAALGIDFLKNMQNTGFGVLNYSINSTLPIAFPVLVTAGAEWAMRYLGNKYGHISSANVTDTTQHPKAEETYLNALDSAPQDVKDLCTLLEIKNAAPAENSEVNFGGQSIIVNNLLPLGYILNGPPGCGKTEIAKAMAQKFGYGFHVINSSDIISEYINTTALNLKKRFTKIRSMTPADSVAIVFIDEIDALTAKRKNSENDAGSTAAEDNKVVNVLLQEIQGFSQSNKKIIVIGATNRIDVIDPAIISRLAKIQLQLPTKDQRFKAIEQQSLKLLGIGLTNELTKWLAHETEGFSYRDLHSLISTFARKALITKCDHSVDLLAQCLEEAKKTIAKDIEI